MDDELKYKIGKLCDNFERDLLELGFEIDHCAEYVGLLRQISTNKVVGVFYGTGLECEWEDNYIGEGE